MQLKCLTHCAQKKAIGITSNLYDPIAQVQLVNQHMMFNRVHHQEALTKQKLLFQISNGWNVPSEPQGSKGKRKLQIHLIFSLPCENWFLFTTIRIENVLFYALGHEWCLSFWHWSPNQYNAIVVFLAQKWVVKRFLSIFGFVISIIFKRKTPNLVL